VERGISRNDGHLESSIIIEKKSAPLQCHASAFVRFVVLKAGPRDLRIARRLAVRRCTLTFDEVERLMRCMQILGS